VSAEYAAENRKLSEYDASVAEYHSSRARYIRTVTSDVERRIMETIGKRREPLMVEITNLTALAHARYEAYRTSLKNYSAKAPGRVKGTAVQAPMPTDRMISGIDKLYKAALKAADEYREVNDIIKKRKDKLGEIDWKMREQIEEYGRSLISQLETERGLEGAFQRDPLLGRAYARMMAAEGRRSAVLSSTPSPLEPSPLEPSLEEAQSA
jgi:hypothetical protein